jgi:hypothetical protein
MRGKLVLLVGVGIGYVLGARAGRERYEDIKVWANRMWNDPRVQHQVHEAEEFAKDKVPDVARVLSNGAKKVVGRSNKERNSVGTETAANLSDLTSPTISGAASGEDASRQAHD